jgi:hypothetical protein
MEGREQVEEYFLGQGPGHIAHQGPPSDAIVALTRPSRLRVLRHFIKEPGPLNQPVGPLSGRRREFVATLAEARQ